MKLGFGLPMAGPHATPEGIVEVTRRAEALNYDSVWTWERLLVPTQPQTGYIGTPDGSYPEHFNRTMDPLDVLTLAAANSSRVGLGTSVIIMGHYHPLTLARRAATIDVISNGRLELGLGQGWSKDEHDAMGVRMSDRARRANEFLEVMKSAWTDDEVEYWGQHFHVPRSHIDLKPVQAGGPPLYLAAFSPGAMQRIATHGDGWAPVGWELDQMSAAMDNIRSMADAAGRDGSALKLIVRGNVTLTEAPLDERFPFVGSFDQVLADIETAEQQGTDTLILDPQGAPPSEYLALMTRIREAIGSRQPAAVS